MFVHVNWLEKFQKEILIIVMAGSEIYRWCACCWTRGRTGSWWTARGCPPRTTPGRRSASPSSACWSGPSSGAQSAQIGSTAESFIVQQLCMLILIIHFHMILVMFYNCFGCSEKEVWVGWHRIWEYFYSQMCLRQWVNQ